jgi:hypothetical protein
MAEEPLSASFSPRFLAGALRAQDFVRMSLQTLIAIETASTAEGLRCSRSMKSIGVMYGPDRIII